jgi:hypothetical protein
MCLISVVGAEFSKTVPARHPWAIDPNRPLSTRTPTLLPPSREEFDALKLEMTQLRELLLAAKKFDEQTGQPDCEMEEKVTLIKRLADIVGVDLKDVFSDHK